MARPSPMSGFPEWLPDGRVVEQHVLDTLRRTFELHGFAGIETRAVEPLDQLLRKGETSKEVYVLRRLQEDGEAGGAGTRGHGDADRGLGLHFDLTVPFARYVLENAGRLAFPFRRYQIQKVWRGERPQEGRFREFVQADVDVVGAGDLPYHYEVELPLVIADAFAALAEAGVPPVRILVNNRKVVEGFARAIGLADVDAVLRTVDKLDKIGPPAVAELLVGEAGATPAQADAMLALADVRGEGAVARVRELAGRHDAVDRLLDEGLAELDALLAAAEERAPGVLTADLRIARGLDYYTGSVYETVLVGHEDLGSICSGGRYDALASDGATTYPGVGLSIGVSRLVSRLLAAGLVRATRGVPSAVVVAVTSEETRRDSEAVATAMRARGIPVEVAPSAAKFGKQIRYADRRGVPFVWFPATSERTLDDGSRLPATGHEVKDIRSGEQVPADPASWAPPAEDAFPRAVPGPAVG